LLREVGDGVDGLFADVRGSFMGKRIEEKTLEGGERVGRQMVVQSQSRLVGLRSGRGDSEQESAEEDEREGAHYIELSNNCKLAECEEVELWRLSQSLIHSLFCTTNCARLVE
jgi:hypothetical protein